MSPKIRMQHNGMSIRGRAVVRGRDSRRIAGAPISLVITVLLDCTTSFERYGTHESGVDIVQLAVIS